MHRVLIVVVLLVAALVLWRARRAATLPGSQGNGSVSSLPAEVEPDALVLAAPGTADPERSALAAAGKEPITTPTLVGPPSRAHNEPLARIRGRVTHRGEPVAQAELSRRLLVPTPESALDLLGAPRRTTWLVFGRTDEQGRFEVALPDKPCRFELCAFALPFGQGKTESLEYDGRGDVDGIEIELTELPGSIEGRVTLPTGHGPEEISLSPSGGRGWRPLRHDGTYVLPGLPPGPCRIEIGPGVEPHWISVVPGYWVNAANGPTRAPDWLTVQPVYRVDVHAGQSTRLDIDLSRPAPCRLQGEVRLSGRPPRLSGVRPTLFLERGQDNEVVSATDLDERGGFALESESPGIFRLRARLELEDCETWIVLDRVALDKGTTPWHLDVPTGGLRVLPPSAERPLSAESEFLLWAEPGDLRVFVHFPLVEKPSGSHLFSRVPSGRVELLVEKGGAQRTLLACEVREGEVCEVRWPE